MSNLLDISGKQTGFCFSGKHARNCLIAVGLGIICLFLPITAISFEAKIALGILVGSTVMFMTQCLPTICIITLMAVLSIGTKIVPLATFQTAFGKSPFLMIMALMVVASGMKYTTLAQRITYFFIVKLGNSRSKLVFVFLLSTSIISAFISDLASLCHMYPIALSVLERLGEVPGKSKTGKVLLMATVWGTFIGGLALMSGNGINVTGVTMLESATEGAYTVSYLQWASIGLPFSLLMQVPTWWVLKTVYRLDKEDKDAKPIDQNYYAEKLKELGKLNPAETRFIIIVLLMVVMFLLGSVIPFFKPIPLVAFITMFLVTCPGIGTINWRVAQKELNWEVLLTVGFVVAFANGITSTGLGGWLVGLVLNNALTYPVWLTLLVCAAVGTLVHFVIVANGNGAVSVLISGVAAITAVAGVNPMVMMLPILFTATVGFVSPIQVSYFMTAESGYYKIHEIMKPAFIVAAIWLVILEVEMLLIAPAIGLL